MRTLPSLVSAIAVTFISASFVHAQAQRPGGEHLGTVHFQTSCAAPVGEEFDHAMALLHSFEFPDAIAGFKRVLQRDPSCGIAQWGIAMSTWGNPFGGLRSAKTLQDGLAAAQTAQTIGATTDREREYIAAVALLYQDADTLDHRARTLAYEKAMERIYNRYPTDLEAAAFYALSVDQTAPPTDKSYANQLKAAAILEQLYKVEPDHPGVTHYLIHSYDVPVLAPRALPYARKYANLAPDAPHALHMPAHTFTRVGSWQESIDTNVRSHAVAMQRGDTGEALHAWDYEMYAFLQTAQDAEAKKILDGLADIVRAPSPAGGRGDMPGMPGMTIGGAGGWAAAAIPARWAVERGAWSDAAALTVRSSAQPYVEAITHFARALGAARSGKPDLANAEIIQLHALQQKEVEAKDAYWATQLDIERRAAEGWMFWAQGKTEAALRTLTTAAALEDTTDKSAITPGPLAPAHELLAEMLLEANQPADALKEFETSLKKEPNRFRSVSGAGRAAESAGDRQKARVYYDQLVKICEHGDQNARPDLDHARQYTAASASAEPSQDARQVFARSPQYPLLPGALEFELALSAAPKHLRDASTVWTLDKSGYTMARQGTNAFSCLVSRRGGDLFPVCWDAEGARSLLPLDFDDAQMRLSGKSSAEIDAIVAERFKSGQYHSPARPGIAYMLSPLRYRIDEGGGVTRTASNPHLMFYGPNLTDGDIGGARGSLVFINRVGPDGMIIVPVGQKEREAILSERQALTEQVERAIGYQAAR
jgi:tetratricopeptide (TPR) repeat protein